MIVIGGRADATARYDLGASASLEEGFLYDLTLCGWELVQLRSKYGVQVVEVQLSSNRGNNYGDLSVDGALPLTLEISFLNRSMFAEPATMYDGPPPRPELDRPNDGRLPDYVIDLED